MKNQYIGRDCQKSWLGQFADLQSGLVKKMGGGVVVAMAYSRRWGHTCNITKKDKKVHLKGTIMNFNL